MSHESNIYEQPIRRSRVPYVMVAAVDFGTTFSGYAFSFQTDPTAIRLNKNWGENVGFHAYKTPTCVLTDDDFKFVAFGYEAEDKYRDAEEEDDSDEENKPSQFHLFKNFKMLLHSTGKLTRTSPISSSDGTIVPAMTIFALCLKYLKDHLLDTVQKQVTKLDESLIRWVLTVPAIWREEAKQFMREAALQAGLIKEKDSKQLLIALEPECASILCRNQEINHFQIEHTGSKESFNTGTKYMIVDAGGGTIDITVHEVLISGTVKELHVATGGPWGGTKVDENFEKLLQDVFGENIVENFKDKYPQQWFTFRLDFEKMKRPVKPDGQTKINVRLPWNLKEFCKSQYGKKIEKIIKEKSHLGVGFSNGMLIIKQEAVDRLFNPVVSKIKEIVQRLMEESEVRECSYMLLVGGFAESSHLQEALQELCRTASIKLLIPSEAQLAIIKGAVLYGHQTNAISTRKARKTYGCEIIPKFNPQIHDRYYLEKPDVVREFKVYVKKGEDITVGEKRSFVHTPKYADQTDMIFNLFCSDDPNVKYIKEKGVELIGSLTIKMPILSGGKERKVNLQMIFGGTEIELEAIDLTSQQKTKTIIDFLS